MEACSGGQGSGHQAGGQGVQAAHSIMAGRAEGQE